MHCVCVCMHISIEKVGILITVLQIKVTIKAFVVTISKTRWQYDVIWCVSSLGSTSTVVLSAAVDRRNTEQSCSYKRKTSSSKLWHGRD
jgi:molybdenum cofactor biosynthesis enzyme